MTLLTLSDLFIYPIKSAAGIRVRQAALTSRGLECDRRYMLVNPEGHFLTQRRFPKMALIQPTLLKNQVLSVEAPGMDLLRVEPFAETAVDGASHPLEVWVEVWGDRTLAHACGPTVDAWFSQFLQTPCQLVHMPEAAQRATDHGKFGPNEVVSFADAYPYLLISEASLAGLNQKLTDQQLDPVPMNRFRPNLVVSGDITPHAEDSWKRIRIGSATFKVAKPCSRCSIPNVNQSTGDRTQEPSRTLATYRAWDKAIWFGQNLLQERSGASNPSDSLSNLSVGDVLEILE